MESLSQEEHQHFLRWLNSELNQTQQYVQKLATILVDSYPISLSPEEIWATLYPALSFDYARFRKLSSDLSGRLEDFVAWLSFRNDDLQRKVQTLRFYNSKNQIELFEKQYRKVKRELDRQPFKNATYHRLLYEVETEYQQIQVRTNQRTRSDLLENISFSLDSWWLHEKLQLSLRIKLKSTQERVSIKHFLPENLFENVSSEELFVNQTLLKVYLDAHNILDNNQIPNTESLITFLSEEKNHLSKVELANLYTLMQHFLVKKLNSSRDQEYAKQFQGLFEWGIKERVAFQDGSLKWKDLYNFIAVLVNLSLVSIADKYLEELIHHVSGNDRDEAYRFIKGFISFFSGKLEDSQKLFSEQKFQNLLFEISARSFLLQTHYEFDSSEPDWHINQAESFIKFLKNKPVPDSMISFHTVFSRRFIKLMRAYSPKELTLLKEEVLELPPSHKQKWLLEKIDKKMG
ncbi:MAG: hypothetical protein AAGC85_22380 [Bacteroidota bacterium]